MWACTEPKVKLRRYSSSIFLWLSLAAYNCQWLVETQQTRQGVSFCLVSCHSRKEEVSRSTHLGLLEVVADLLHERGVVSPLHRELSVFKVEAAAGRLALSVHGTICKAPRGQSYSPAAPVQTNLHTSHHNRSLFGVHALINTCRASAACMTMRLAGFRPRCPQGSSPTKHQTLRLKRRS